MIATYTIWKDCAKFIFAFGFGGWLYSLVSKKVHHVDSMWSLFFFGSAAIAYRKT